MNKGVQRFSGLLLLPGVFAVTPLVAQTTLYRSDAFTITDRSVRQGPFEALALSRDSIVSSYPRAAREVMFKFSVNGYESEFPPGTDHMIYLRPREGRIVTPVYRFGVVDPPTTPEPEASAGSEEGTVEVTFRVDLREVLRSLADTGVYEPPNGPPIREIEGVYVIGNTEPLSWDFSRLRPGAPVELTDADQDSVYTVTLPFEAAYTRPVGPDGRAIWARSTDLAGYPDLESPQILVDALHRLSLEEMVQLRQEDGTLMAGAKWPGVWTRDVAWGAMMGMVFVDPEAIERSLRAKVDSAGRIIQDTGTGGSWPVSTDRMAWALVAWELYLATGDGEWLRFAYEAIRRSAEADLHAAFDPATGLFRGESSFLDWRDQSYPPWMDPKDIYLSQALGTNAIHHGTYRVLAEMARLLGEPTERWEDVADRVREGMNQHLWQETHGWYGQYRYGRIFPSVSPRAEGLGEALATLYGAASPERSAELVRRNPVVPFGVPSFWPYIPGVPPYHNAGIWPQVVGFWAWAAAETGNGAAVEHALASIYRAAALFLTNKENMVAATGHFEGTELNSDRLIGSVGANLATIYRVLFGLRAHPDRLEVRPFVPEPFAGERTLRNLRWRDARLTITVRGFGDAPARATLDGRPIPRAEVPAELTGDHTLEIEMNGRVAESSIHVVEDADAPGTPEPVLHGDTLAWAPVEGAVHYVVHRNGRPIETTTETAVAVPPMEELGELQVLAVDERGFESFLSEPLRVPPAAGWIVEVEREAAAAEHAGYTGTGYVETAIGRNERVEVSIEVPAAGEYAIDVRYANGSGPVNSSDKAAVRTLLVDGRPAGVIVLPQRGTDLWTDWGYTNPVRVSLEPGKHTLTLEYTPLDANMNGAVNTALLDHVRVARLDGAQ
jgi:hypothetical protein